MKADLHMHSTHSDGRYTMRQLVDEAVTKHIQYIAITDHDTIGDIDDAIAYGKQHNITVIPGVELSTLEQNKSVHLLGYFRDQSYQNKELRQYFDTIKRKREERAKAFITNLKQHFNIEITYERVLAHSSGIIARPHIAKAIIESYPEYTHDMIFDQFIGDHSPAYIPSVELPVNEGIALLKRHNCIVVLAHPTLLKPHIKDTVLSYAYDGLEATYPLNKDNETRDFQLLAASRGIITTGGSDFHGIEGDTKHGQFGEYYIEGEELITFLKSLNSSI